MEMEERDAAGGAVKNDEETVEQATDIIGAWGVYQKRLIVICLAFGLIGPALNMVIVFYTPKLTFWCKRPPGFENATAQTCASYEDVTKPCTEFEYEMGDFQSTIVDEVGCGF